MVNDKFGGPTGLLRSFRRSLQGPDGSSAGRGPSVLSEWSQIHMSGEQAMQYYAKKEVAEAREMIKKLEAKCEAAQSYREKSSKLLEEALRALGRLEQALTRKCGEDLIVSASEIKACVQQGTTLVNVYGKHGAFVKMATLVMRKSIYAKYDQVTEKLRAIVPTQRPPLPPPQPAPAAICPPPTPVQSTGGQPLAHQPGSSLARASPSTMLPPSSKASARDLQSKESAAPMSEGTVIRPARHDKVYAMACVPAQLTNNYANIWWSAGMMLEYWTEANGSTVTFNVDKETHVVTALGLDEQGNIWTGHIKGLLRVRPRNHWDQQAEDKAFSSQVRVIVFDDQGQAWVGDADGKVKIFRYHAPTSRRSTSSGGVGEAALALTSSRASFSRSNSKAKLEHVATLQHSLLTRVAEGAKSMLPNMWHVLGGRDRCNAPKPGGTERTSPAGKDLLSQGPIRAMLIRDGRTWIGGGLQHCSLWLALVDTASYQDLDVYDCRPAGAINTMTAIEWPQQVMGPSNSLTRDLSRSSRHFASSSCWRLLTGHETGQLMLWHPRSDRLAPLMRIGEPMSPVRGIHVCEELSLVITGHQNGELHMFVLQRGDTMLPPGSESAHPDSLGTVRPKKLVIKAHKSNLVALMQGNKCFCTASSQGTIRFWSMADIGNDVSRAGLLGAWGPGAATNINNAMSAVTAASSGCTVMTAGTAPSAALPETLPLVPSTGSSFMAPHGSLHHAASTGGILPHGSPATSPNALHGTVVLSRADTEQQQVEVAGGPARQPSANAGMAPSQPTSGSSAGNGAGRVRRHSSVGMGEASSIPESMASSSQPTHTFSISQGCQTIDQNELTLRRVIGQGAYGKVWLAEWTGCAVAVKELLGFGMTPDDSKLWQEMQNEVHLLGTYNHPNIMRFMAVCLMPPMIVMQYYPHGSLFDLLSRARNNNVRAIKELAWTKRLDMMRDVAAGMHYLHTRKPPVIHGDLRSPNLLLDLTIDRERPRFHVKIADFGLARMLGPTSTNIMVSKTTNPRWTAPEVIQSSQIGPAGDVYSFAIIMWEVLTWQQPYEDMMSVQVILRTVTDHDRPITPPDHMLPGSPGVTLGEYKALMQKCWAANAQDRPTFKQIVDVFQTMRDAEARAARSASGTRSVSAGSMAAGQAGTPGGTGAGTPGHSSEAPSPVVFAPLGTPGTPASSRGSVKSETAAALLAAANAQIKDSASSMGDGSKQAPLAGKVPSQPLPGQSGLSSTPAGAASPPSPAMGLATGLGGDGGGSQRSTNTVVPRGNLFGTMSPIVEERSQSLTFEAAQAQQQAAQAAASPFAFGNDNSMSPMMGTSPPITLGVPYHRLPSFINAPVNLLDGDDGSDPLEAYRSGALEEFGYSKSTIFNTMGLLNTNGSPNAAAAAAAAMAAAGGSMLGSLVEADEEGLDAAAAGCTWQDGGVGCRRPSPLPPAAAAPQLTTITVTAAPPPPPLLVVPDPASAAPAHPSPASGRPPLHAPPVAHRHTPFANDETGMFVDEPRTSPLQKMSLPNSPVPWSTTTRQQSGGSEAGPASPSGSPRATTAVRHRPSRSYDHAELGMIVTSAQATAGPGPSSTAAAARAGHGGVPTASGRASAPRTAAGSAATMAAHGHAGPAHPSRLGLSSHTGHVAGAPKSPPGVNVERKHSDAGSARSGASFTSMTSRPSLASKGKASNNSTPMGSRNASPQRNSAGSHTSHLAAGSEAGGGLAHQRSQRTSATKPGVAPRSSAGAHPARTSAHSSVTSTSRGPQLLRPVSDNHRGPGSGASAGVPPVSVPQKQRSGEAPPSSPAGSASSSLRGSRASSPALKPAHSADLQAGSSSKGKQLTRSTSNLGLDGGSPKGSTQRDASPRMVAISNARQGSLRTSAAAAAKSHIPNPPSIPRRLSGGGGSGHAPGAAAASPQRAGAAAARSKLPAGGAPSTRGGAAAASVAAHGNAPAAAHKADGAVKYYAPLTAYSPFSVAQHQQDADAPSASTSSLAVAGTAADMPAQTPAQAGTSRTAAAQAGDRYYAPMSKYSPFANAEPQPVQTAAAPAASTAGGPCAAAAAVLPQAAQARAAPSTSAAEPKYYAPLSAFSPFSQAQQQVAPAPATTAAPAAHPASAAAAGAAAAPCYSPLSKLSPFANAGPAAPQPQPMAAPAGPSSPSPAAGAGMGMARANSIAPAVPAATASAAKPWAPLTAHSPFSAVQEKAGGSGAAGSTTVPAPQPGGSSRQPAGPPNPARQQQQRPAAAGVGPEAASGISEPKYYAPLSHFSPFAQADMQGGSAGDQGRPAAAGPGVSVVSNGTTTPAGPSVMPQAAGTTQAAAKYYSPMSAYSPFHAAQQQQDQAPAASRSTQPVTVPVAVGEKADVPNAGAQQGQQHSPAVPGTGLSAFSPFSGASYQVGWQA